MSTIERLETLIQEEHAAIRALHEDSEDFKQDRDMHLSYIDALTEAIAALRERPDLLLCHMILERAVSDEDSCVPLIDLDDAVDVVCRVNKSLAAKLEKENTK